MNPLLRLTATEALEQVHGGRLSARALTEAYLARIEERESTIQAFAHLDVGSARADADAWDRAATLPPLVGLPVGVKDIFETAGMPTAHGSPLYAGNKADVDAELVQRLRAAGAIFPGKTVTTEFAGPAPSVTRNPHNPAFTPGGSSAGSAAAVADFMLPVAIGTQTAGSIVRPAAYCGVVGAKPSFGALPLRGVRRCAPSFDTAGVFARNVRDAALLLSVLMGDRTWALQQDDAFLPRIGLCRPPEWEEAEACTRETLASAAELFSRRGARVLDVALPAMFSNAVHTQWTVMAAETARTTPEAFDERQALVSREMRAFVQAGAAVSAEVEAAARAQMISQRAALTDMFDDVDILLCPSATGEPPEGLSHTGDPVFNRVWTGMGTPCIALPFGRGPRGMPVGIQVIGRRDDDRRTLAAALWLERTLAAFS